MNIFFNWPMRRTLFLLFFVIIIPFLVITLYSTFTSREDAMENARQRTLQLVETIVAEQHNHVVSTRQLLSTLARMPEFQRRNVEMCTGILHELLKQSSMYTNLSLVDSQGNVIASSQSFKPTNVKHRKYFQEALKTKDFSVGEYAVGSISKKPVLHYAYPVMDSKNVLKGILFAAFDLDHYEEIFKKSGLPQGSNLAITDHKGVRLFRHPIVKETVGKNDLSEMMAFMSGPDEQGTFLNIGVDGVKRLYAFSRIRLRDQEPPYMFVRAGIPEALALAGANDMLKRNFLIIGLTILVSILFAWYLGKIMFIRRLEQLNAFAGRVQKGETGVRTAVPHTSDELGMLAKSFDNMAEVIEERDREKGQAYKRLNEIIEFLPDATLVIDNDRKVIAWNRAIEQMTGIPKEDMIGKGNYEYAIPFYGERRPILIDLAFLPDAEFEKGKYDTVYRSVGTLYGAVYVPKTYGGKGAYLSATASRLRDASGNVIGAIESIRDITERIQAEEVRFESEERFRITLMSIGDGVITTDAEGLVDILNPVAENLSGWSQEEARGKPLEEVFCIINEETRQPVENPVLQVLREGIVVGLANHTVLIARNGTERPIADSGAPILGADGAITGTVLIFRDQTEERKVQNELEALERRLSKIIDFLPDPTLAIDSEKRVIVWNRAMEELTGVPAAEMLGKGDYAYTIPFYGVARPQLMDLFWVPAHEITQKYPAICKDRDNLVIEVFCPALLGGKGAHVWAKAAPLCDKEGHLVGAIEIIRDMTAHKRAEEELKRYSEEISDLYNNAPCGYHSLGPDGDFLRINDTELRWLGYTRDEVIGKMNWSDLLPPESLKVFHETFPVFREQSWINNVEVELIRKNATTFPVILNATAIKDEKGNYIRSRSTLFDITERKRAEEERRRMEERLQRAEKMEALGTLAGGVAHDLNNVLGIVVGYAEMLLMDSDESDPIRPRLLNIMSGGERAAAIVQDLLTLARRGVPGRKVLNLNSIIADFQQLPELEKLSSYHSSVQIKTDCEPELLNISGSSVHLAKTLFNLVSNASEAIKKGGIVTIKTANQYLDKPIQGYDEVREGDYVVLSVSDTGEGIPAADLKRIFEPFYTKKVMGRSGTGLGLAVVWGTMRDHHGYINVESEEGKGSIFTLYFPVTREDISAEAVAIAISEYMGHGESILVVDDVKEQRDLAAEMLQTLDYNVTTVSSGEEALAYLKEHQADLMVLDMIMDPGMDGLDTYRSVLEIRPKQKAIIVSGFSETNRVHAAQSLGAGDYVRKPYVIEKLGLAVRNELDKSTN